MAATRNAFASLARTGGEYRKERFDLWRLVNWWLISSVAISSAAMRASVPSQSWRSLNTMSGPNRSMELAKLPTASTSILPAVRTFTSSSSSKQASPNNEPADFRAVANRGSNQLSLETPRNNVGEYSGQGRPTLSVRSRNRSHADLMLLFLYSG
jgi:hypothetical protein